MTTVTAASTAAATCEARTGFYPGDFGELPLWCSTRIGLVIWTDADGRRHRACRHHVDALRRRYPSEEARVASVIEAATHELAPPAKASPRCESGGYPGCTCDVCF